MPLDSYKMTDYSVTKWLVAKEQGTITQAEFDVQARKPRKKVKVTQKERIEMMRVV